MRGGIETAAATLRSAAARSVILSIIEVVVVGQLFARRDVAQRDDPHLAANLIGLAVRLAGMIDEGSDSVAIDDALAAVESEQIGVLEIVVKVVGLFLGEGRADILHHQLALADGPRGVAAIRVDARLANHERHGRLFNL